jgi:endonuclease III
MKSTYSSDSGLYEQSGQLVARNLLLQQQTPADEVQKQLKKLIQTYEEMQRVLEQQRKRRELEEKSQPKG